RGEEGSAGEGAPAGAGDGARGGDGGRGRARPGGAGGQGPEGRRVGVARRGGPVVLGGGRAGQARGPAGGCGVRHGPEDYFGAHRPPVLPPSPRAPAATLRAVPVGAGQGRRRSIASRQSRSTASRRDRPPSSMTHTS